MRRLLAVTAAGAVASALVVALAQGGTSAQLASAAVTNNGLAVHVVLTNRQPLPACLSDGSNCAATNTTWNYIYVKNSNQLQNTGGARSSVANAFVASSIDETTFVDGAQYGSIYTLTPPPNLTQAFGSAGRWPSTVTCGQPISVPCNVVGPPAVLPGENTAISYLGWIHADGEPNGTYVFKFTLHGTLNGVPVDLNGSSPPIRMTS